MADDHDDTSRDLDPIEAPLCRSENTRRFLELLDEGYHFDSDDISYVPSPPPIKHVLHWNKQIETQNGKSWTSNSQPLAVEPHEYQRPKGEVWGFEISVVDESDPDPTEEAVSPFTLKTSTTVKGQGPKNTLLDANVFQAVFDPGPFDAREEALRLAKITCDITRWDNRENLGLDLWI